jgi:hypothetical protein
LLLINVTKPFVLAITVTSEEYIHSSCFVLNLRHVMPNTVVCISSPARGFSDVFVSQGSGFRKGGRRERERESEREGECPFESWPIVFLSFAGPLYFAKTYTHMMRQH